jgi:hypothetical protein
MSTPQIEILVTPTGETRIKTHGFQGAACRDATKALERVLGRKLSETLTTEFHSMASTENYLAERPADSC